MTERTKRCKGCAEKDLDPIRPISAFAKRYDRTHGKQSKCRECLNAARRKRYKEDPNYATKVRSKSMKWAKDNPEKSKARAKKWSADNREKTHEKTKKWVKDNPEKYREYRERWIKDNPKKLKGYRKKWSEANPEKCKASRKKWTENNREELNVSRVERYKEDLNYRLRVLLRGRLRKAIHKKTGKTGSAVTDLGCAVSELIVYIESKFAREMSWGNHGNYWELDHIQPLFSFDLTDREQFLTACHYTNLQPLTVKKHKEKTRKELQRG